MLEILRPGLLSTVQDAGRHGYRHLGVVQAGAMDSPALTLANRLVNNPAGSAALEIGGGPVEIRFGRDGWFALCGALHDAWLDGEEVWSGWRLPFRAGQRLKLAGPRRGMWLYLAIDGGIAVPEVLGARATDLQAGFGGLAGRALKAGDCLPLGSPDATLAARCGVLQPQWEPVLRALPGPDHDDFDVASREAFWNEPWRVTAQSNRMGYRLEGLALARNKAPELLSHAVLPGVVQVPPSGQPIVLMADAQTAGGYPRIACVIGADLWKLAQATPGTRLHFVPTDQAGARRALGDWQLHLRRFEWSAYGS